MKITKLSPQAKNPNRVNVYVDGDFYCGVELSVAMSLALAPGMTLTPELVTQLGARDEFARGWNYALRCLETAGQSALGLRQKLTRRIGDDSLVEQIMARLIEANLLDDRKFAEALIQRYSNMQTKSPREISLILRRKGIDPAVIKQVTPTVLALDTTEALVKLAEAKLRRMKDTDPRIRFQKVASYLVQKGFNYGQVKTVLNKIGSGLEAKHLG